MIVRGFVVRSAHTPVAQDVLCFPAHKAQEPDKSGQTDLFGQPAYDVSSVGISDSEPGLWDGVWFLPDLSGYHSCVISVFSPAGRNPMRNSVAFLISVCLFVVTLDAYGQAVPSDAALARIGLKRHWVSQGRVNPGRDRVTHISTDEMHVYVQSSNGSLTALDSETGRRHWVVQLGAANRTSFAAVSNADTVLVVTSTNAYGVEKSSGHVLWTVKMPASASTSAIIDDEFFYIGTGDGSMYAFSLAVVEYKNRTGRLPGTFDPSTKTITSPIGEVPALNTWLWRYRTGRSLREPPILTGGNVLLADTRGQVYGISSGTPQELGGQLRFQFQAGAGIAGKMISKGDVTYVPTTDNVMTAVDSSRGQLLWRFTFGRTLVGDPLMIDGKLYLSADYEGLVALDISNGAQVTTAYGPWKVRGVTEMLGATKKAVYVSDRQRGLIAIDRETGRPRGKLTLYPYSIRLQNDLNDRLYLASTGGQVLCLRDPEADEPHFYRNQDRTPILPELAGDNEEAGDNEKTGNGEPPPPTDTGDNGN